MAKKKEKKRKKKKSFLSLFTRRMYSGIIHVTKNYFTKEETKIANVSKPRKEIKLLPSCVCVRGCVCGGGMHWEPAQLEGGGSSRDRAQTRLAAVPGFPLLAQIPSPALRLLLFFFFGRTT